MIIYLLLVNLMVRKVDDNDTSSESDGMATSSGESNGNVDSSGESNGGNDRFIDLLIRWWL